MDKDQLAALAQRAIALASDIRALKSEAQDRDRPDLYGLIEDAEDAVDLATGYLNSAALAA
jgi:hypothetical protein